MHGSPYFQGARPAPSPVASMAGRVDSFDGGQAGNFQLFLPTTGHSHGRPTELATSESTGTNSSQYSGLSNNLVSRTTRYSFLTDLFGLFIRVKL